MSDKVKELVESHMDIARLVANSFHKKLRYIPLDDLFSSAMMGLFLAAKKYDAGSSDASFQTFARKRINGAVIDDLRATGRFGKKNKGKFKIRKDIRSKDILDFDVEDTVDIDEKIFFMEVWPDAKRTMESMDERLRTILLSYYFEDKTLREIGYQLGLTEARVSQLRMEAIRTMRKAVNDEKLI